MKALLFNEKQELAMKDVPVPSLRDENDALIEIKATGICGTDIHIIKKEYNAKPGIILGHESAGIVKQAGAYVKNVKQGDKVILDPTYHCGICAQCQNNKPNHCVEKQFTETGVSYNGTYAKYHVANASFLHSLPENVSFEEGTLAEPLACALNALRQTRIRPEFRVLVIGAGPLGLLFAIAVESMGCEVAIGDINEYRVGKAKELFKEVQNYGEKDLLAANSNRAFDLIIDTSGRALEEALKIIGKGGDILLIGLDSSFEAKIKPAYLTDNGIRLIGSIDSNLTFAPAIKMLSQNKKFKKIITHSYPIEEYQKAFETLGMNLKTGERKKIAGNKVVILPT
jgi:threonine dehydrogenase-like Zn-dependent dehydrogenase